MHFCLKLTARWNGQYSTHGCKNVLNLAENEYDEWLENAGDWLTQYISVRWKMQQLGRSTNLSDAPRLECSAVAAAEYDDEELLQRLKPWWGELKWNEEKSARLEPVRRRCGRSGQYVYGRLNPSVPSIYYFAFFCRQAARFSPSCTWPAACMLLFL